MTTPGHEPLELRSCPELAAALLTRAEGAVDSWESLVRRAVPRAATLDAIQLRDHLTQILAAIAAALASDDPEGTLELAGVAPEQGVTRFHQHYDIRELMTEDRLLRRVVIEHVSDELGRSLSVREGVALNLAVDVMLHGAVVAYFDKQEDKLRAAAEAELKYLAFLSHDLNNNLGAATLWLRLHRDRLAGAPQFADDVAALDQIDRAIAGTVRGMERLLQAERLRKQGVATKAGPVDLPALAAAVADPFRAQAGQKGVAIAVEVEPAACASDGDLIALVLQNLVGNAVKYSARGCVRVRGGPAADGGCVLSVSDDGPGIAPQYLDHVFEAFRRGDSHGQDGVGLGLTIVAQAAKLLGGELSVESAPGRGSTFRLTLPARA
ncbi:MAG TPA: HAMP domain-containing sensor histidine kinase [Tepidisphaeraceae bacterium]|nr:HAMP domain-containing sensor histidine kinase [Tepidisphaeraceae bacterium]